MSSAQVTPEVVRDLWKHMNQAFNARVVSKADATEMRAAAWALEAMGISDANAFLEHFATTVGRRVYVPFLLGIVKGGWDLWKQIEVAAHEHQHIVQMERAGPARYPWRYLRNDVDRARYEADARTADLELHFWRYGKVSVASKVEGLKHYALGDKHVATAKAILETRAETITRGGLITRAGKVAIAWLNEHAPHLRFVQA